MGTSLGMAGKRSSTSMRHTLTKQMVLSQPHLTQGTRGEPEAVNTWSLEGLQSFQKSLDLELTSSPKSMRIQLTNREGWWDPTEGLRWSCYLCQVNQQAVDLCGSIMHRTQTVISWHDWKRVTAQCCQAVHVAGTGINTIVFIVISSIAERSTASLKLPVLRSLKAKLSKCPTPSFPCMPILSLNLLRFICTSLYLNIFYYTGSD